MQEEIGTRRWAEAHIKIARMTLTIKLDRNWSSFQLANRAPPLSVTDSSIAPSARMHHKPARPSLHLDTKTERGHEGLAFKVRESLAQNRSIPGGPADRRPAGPASSANCKRKRDTRRKVVGAQVPAKI